MFPEDSILRSFKGLDISLFIFRVSVSTRINVMIPIFLICFVFCFVIYSCSFITFEPILWIVQSPVL